MKHLFILMHGYLIIINIIFACIVLFFERKRPMYTLFWIMILLLTSYFGFILYIFFGLAFKRRRDLNKYYYAMNAHENESLICNESKISIKKWFKLIKYLDGVSIGKLSYNNEFKLYDNPIVFLSGMKRAIKNAKDTIYMEYYIFADDEVGSEIYDLLIKKSKAGVEVKIIVDGAGTKNLSKKRKKELRHAGVMFKVFFPSYFPFVKVGNLRGNYRNHRKLTIIDNSICFSGGINIGKDYIGKGKFGHWQDLGFSIKGESVIDYLHEFEVNWKFLKKDKTDKFQAISFKNDVKTLTPALVVSSGPNHEFNTVKDTLLQMILKAEKSLYIETPYFVPPEHLLEALKATLVSGVQVKIIIPNVGDHMFVYWANQYFYGELLELGAEIYKYKTGFMHSKLAIVDGEVAFLGTANFDYRSMYQNFEINLMLFGTKVKELEKRFNNNIKMSKKVELKEYKNRGRWEKILESISKLMAPIL